MYQKIINELNNFLNKVKVSPNPLNPDVFQGIFVKKLSNQNISKDKRRINVGDTVSTVNQTHIDVTGRQSMLFFFETLNNQTTPTQNIDIDLYVNNLKYLSEINSAERKLDITGNTFFVRSPITYPTHLTNWDKVIHSSAYKKYGHTGKQVQINIPDSNEPFTQLQKTAFQDDALVMLRYNHLHYLAILIPVELCDTLYFITNTRGNQNVNIVINNTAYNEVLARRIQRDVIFKDVMYDEIDAETLQKALYSNPSAGTDVNKIVKARISQGAFRRLLLLEHHQCRLCNITTTSVLRASHIKEWSESSREERMDSNNGLLLCANHDALFDRHLISFEPNTGNICISASINMQQRKSLSLSETESIPLSNEMKPYMQEHYTKYMAKENF